jgi:hypothetical protein
LTWEPHTHARVGDPSTSHDAAARVTAAASQCEALARAWHNEWLTLGGGLTNEEAALLVGMQPERATKRTADLLHAGVIIDTGRTRVARTGRRQRVLAWNPDPS